MKKYVFIFFTIFILLSIAIISYSNPKTNADILKEADQNPLNCAYFITSNLKTGNRRVVFKQIAINFSKLGEYDLAIQIANQQIEEYDGTIEAALMGILDNCISSGKTEYVSTLLPQIVQIAEKSNSASLLTKVAVIAYDFGQKNEALKYLNNAYNQAKMNPKDETNYRDLVLIDVVEGYAKIGQYEKANEVVSAVSKTYKQSALSKIALEYGNKKDYDYALQMISKLESDTFKATALTELADKYICAGLTADAAGLLNQSYQLLIKAEDSFGKIVYMNNIARLFNKIGDTNKALDIVNMSLEESKTIENQNTKDSALEKIAISYGSIGQHERALKVIDTMQSPEWKIYGLTRVAASSDQSKAVSFTNKAFQIANAMGNNNISFKDVALLEVAIGYGEVGLLVEAVKTVKLISSDFRKAQALADIGLAYQRAGMNSDEVKTILYEIIKGQSVVGKGKK